MTEGVYGANADPVISRRVRDPRADPISSFPHKRVVWCTHNSTSHCQIGFVPCRLSSVLSFSKAPSNVATLEILRMSDTLSSAASDRPRLVHCAGLVLTCEPSTWNLRDGQRPTASHSEHYCQPRQYVPAFNELDDPRHFAKCSLAFQRPLHLMLTPWASAVAGANTPDNDPSFPVRVNHRYCTQALQRHSELHDHPGGWGIWWLEARHWNLAGILPACWLC